ncbi:MAG: ABC transporter permease subunit [Clostridiales bacterium]|nr:ABC transporter permease subunit [Clostridiales bacterium]
MIAFKDFRPRTGIFGSPWAQDLFGQFKRFFGSYYFSDLIKNTLYLAVGILITSVPLAIVFALLLNRCASNRLKKLVQNVSYMPYFISMVVFVGLLNIFFSYQGGLVNNIFGLFGFEPKYWLGDASFFRPLYIWSGVWKNTGYQAIVYLAALSGVSMDLEDAAIVDGANKLQRIYYIDLPTITPIIATMALLAIGNTMNIGFEKALLMQSSINLQYSNIIPTYVYTQGIQGGQYSFGTAISLFNSLINTSLLVIANLVSKRLTNNSLW